MPLFLQGYFFTQNYIWYKERILLGGPYYAIGTLRSNFLCINKRLAQPGYSDWYHIRLWQSLFISYISFLMTEKMISQQQENSGWNYKDHIFCNQQTDHHPKTYKKKHKANELFQFSCTFSFSLVCYSLCRSSPGNV